VNKANDVRRGAKLLTDLQAGSFAAQESIDGPAP
jgi:hypothetical protein